MRYRPLNFCRIRIFTLALCVMAPSVATADDPCQEADAEVRALLTDLNRAAGSGAPHAGFRVAQISPAGAPGSFALTLTVQGRQVLSRRLEHRAEVSDDLALRVTGNSASALKLSYGSGSSVSCNYTIHPAAVRFVASFRHRNGRDVFRKGDVL